MNIKFRNLYADEIDIRVGQTLNTPNFQGVSMRLWASIIGNAHIAVIMPTVLCLYGIAKNNNG